MKLEDQIRAGFVRLVEVKSSRARSSAVPRTASSRRASKAVGSAKRRGPSPRLPLVPWVKAVRRFKDLSEAELHRRVGWTEGMAYWRKRKAGLDLRASDIARMADAIGVDRGKFFVALCEEYGWYRRKR